MSHQSFAAALRGASAPAIWFVTSRSMQLSESGEYAVGILAPETGGGGGTDLDAYQDENWGLLVINTVTDQVASLVIVSEPVGLALVEQDETTYALVLMDGVETLLQVDLAQPSADSQQALPAPPTRIGSMPDERFYITHDSALGLISFLDPSTGKLTKAHGFATADLMSDDVLPRRDANK